jgi:hypothetical protein
VTAPRQPLPRLFLSNARCASYRGLRWAFAIVGLLFPLLGVGRASGGIIPPDRRTIWNPGVPGGVPVRTTICATLDASTYGNGAQDASKGIQAGIDACPPGQVVLLSAGDFKIAAPLLITRAIVLRGQGPRHTKLKMPVGTNANPITIGTRWFKTTQATDLAGDATKGSRTVTLAANPGLIAGEIVLVDQRADPSITQWSPKSRPGDASRTWFMRPDRPVGQVLEVASVDGATATFTTPFHIDMRTAFGAQLSRFSNAENGPVVPAVKYAGIEDLYVSGGSQGQGNLKLANAAYSWIRNVESDYQDGESVGIDGSFRCVVRDSYFHSTQMPQPGGGGYGVSFSWHSADNLVENNIVWNMNKVMVMRASGGGNVVGYNYMEDGWIRYNPGWMEVGLNASHMTTPHFELFEGNEAFNFDGDNTWGNAVYITVFRNHLTGKRRSIPPLQLSDVQNRRAIGLMKGHWWYTFVGNVLGTPDQTSAPFGGFRYEDHFPWRDDPIGLWRLGYNPEDWRAPADPKVLSTIMRGGNYEYATHSIHWEDIPPQAIPDSLYLGSKPSFFGSHHWPWVDPTGATKLHVLPARQRFDGMKEGLSAVPAPARFAGVLGRLLEAVNAWMMATAAIRAVADAGSKGCQTRDTLRCPFLPGQHLPRVIRRRWWPEVAAVPSLWCGVRRPEAVADLLHSLDAVVSRPCGGAAESRSRAACWITSTPLGGQNRS